MVLLREESRGRKRRDPCAGRGVGLALLVTFLSAAAAGPAAAQLELRPNVRALPAVSPFLQLVSPSGVELRFGTRCWNSGLGPVEIRGGAFSPDGQSQELWQRVYRSDQTYTDYLAG